MIGWLSTFFLAICGLPQAVKSYKEGHANGLSNGFLFCWTTGEIFLIIHTYMVADYPVLANAIANLLIMCFILRYKFYPRKPSCYHSNYTIRYGRVNSDDNVTSVTTCLNCGVKLT